MKTNNRIREILRGSRLALVAVFSAFAMASQANPQYKATADDGVAASPKVRVQLNERKARANSSSASVEMACPKCKDEYVRVSVKGAKGAQILMAGAVPTQKVAKHLCAGCETTIKVAGQGKGKHEVVSHECTSCGTQNIACCSSKGSPAVATQGMIRN